MSSPGVERVIRKDWQIKKYIGKEINIKLFKKDEQGVKEYQGILNKFNDNELFVGFNDKEIKIERKNISLIKTVYKW